MLHLGPYVVSISAKTLGSLGRTPIEGFCEGVGKADTVEVRGEEEVMLLQRLSVAIQRGNIRWRFWGP